MPQKAYLVNIHRYGFHCGEPAEILGVVFFTPPGIYELRLCYRVKFKNGDEDYVALSDSNNFEIICEQDVLAGKIPEITR